MEQAEELRRELSSKNTELQYKNNLANVKLKQVVNDQQEAEKKTSRQIRSSPCFCLFFLDRETKDRYDAFADVIVDCRDYVWNCMIGGMIIPQPK